MIVYLIKECDWPMDRIRAAFVKEEDANKECDRLNKAMPNSDGFYVEPMEVKE